MAGPKNAATEEAAGSLHNHVFNVLLEMTQPQEIELEDGSVERVYDKDYLKMSLAALKDNKITVVETAENSAGLLRKQLAERKKPMFKNNVQPLYITEDSVNAAE